MALKQNISLENNFGEKSHFLGAYIKVSVVSGSKKIMTATVEFLREPNGRKLSEKQYFFQPNIDGKNFIAQAYDHLKTLNEFSNSEDC